MKSHDEVNNSECPRCGFSYMFDGNTCGHCNYPEKTKSVDRVEFKIIDYTYIATAFVFIAFVITLIYFLVRKDFVMAGLSFILFIAVVVAFIYVAYNACHFFNERDPGRKLLLAIEEALNGKDASIDRVRKLIDAGADVNYAKIVGVTPLSRAVEEGQSDIVKLLLEAGADVNLRVQNRSTHLMRLKESPLFIASRGGSGLGSSFKGNDIRQLPDIASLYAADNELKKLTRSSRAKIVKLLLEAGANVENGQQGGATPLWVASQVGNEEIVKLLLGAKAKVDARSTDGATPLIAASERGHYGVVTLLLQAGANVNLRMKTNDTALKIASKMGRKQIARLLRNTGDDKRENVSFSKVRLDPEASEIRDIKKTIESHENFKETSVMAKENRINNIHAENYSNKPTVEMIFHDCLHCGVKGMLLMSDGRCPNCKKMLKP